MNELYPPPWREDFEVNISKTLASKNIRDCGQYKYRESRRDKGEYLVRCTGYGANWTAYLVWSRIGEVSGPYTPDPSLTASDSIQSTETLANDTLVMIETPNQSDAATTVVPPEYTYEYDLRKIQALLKQLGFDPGPLDGVMGSKTRSALRQFQDNQQIEPTGEMDQPTSALLTEIFIKFVDAAEKAASDAFMHFPLSWEKAEQEKQKENYWYEYGREVQSNTDYPGIAVDQTNFTDSSRSGTSRVRKLPLQILQFPPLRVTSLILPAQARTITSAILLHY